MSKKVAKHNVLNRIIAINLKTIFKIRTLKQIKFIKQQDYKKMKLEFLDTNLKNYVIKLLQINSFKNNIIFL